MPNNKMAASFTLYYFWVCFQCLGDTRFFFCRFIMQAECLRTGGPYRFPAAHNLIFGKRVMKKHCQ